MVSDSYYPGWRAAVDGRPVPLLRTNVLLRGVPVPAGRHQVRLWFDPLSVRLGFALSALALVANGAALAWVGWSGRRGSSGARGAARGRLAGWGGREEAPCAGPLVSGAPQAQTPAAWLLLTLFLLCVYLLTMSGRVISGDGETMYLTTRALVTEGSLAIVPRPESAEGRDGRWYSKYGLGQTAVQLPFFVAGHAIGKALGATDDRAARFAVGMANSVVSAALAGLFWLTLRALGSGRGAATAATLVFGLATLAWPYARADFAEPLQAFSVLLAFYALIRWRRRPGPGWATLAGLAAGLALLTKAASAVLLLPLGAYFLYALWQWRHAGPPGPPAGRPGGRNPLRPLRPGAGGAQPGPLRERDRVRLRRRAPHGVRHPAGHGDLLPPAQPGEGALPLRPPGAPGAGRAGCSWGGATPWRRGRPSCSSWPSCSTSGAGGPGTATGAGARATWW